MFRNGYNGLQVREDEFAPTVSDKMNEIGKKIDGNVKLAKTPPVGKWEKPVHYISATCNGNDYVKPAPFIKLE